MASSNGGHQELQFKKGDKRIANEKRMPHSLSVESYVAEVSDPGAEEDGDNPESDFKKIHFTCGNPTTEVTKGLVHLYKENDRTYFDPTREGVGSDMICMLAVPSNMSCRDLLQFIAAFQIDIEHVKIIRDCVPNQYMVLVKFRTEKAADMFYNTYNGTAYNSFEDDVCNLAFVSRVETVNSADGDGFTLIGHTELPTCPVCLERMDESVDGVLTILCNHTFHSACLSKWSDSRCPVCRYVQTPEFVASNQCFECHSSESLWICLICGHIGCGRYVHGHAYKHFCETSHCYAIQPDNNRVWDYVGDNFVHRLMHNKGDGKLVEVHGRRNTHDSCEETDEKLDSMQVEFSSVLTSQLEAQRFFFEEKLNKAQNEVKKELEEMREKLSEKIMEKEESDKLVAALTKDKANLERKIAQLTQKVAKVSAEMKEERDLNQALKGDQKHWQEMVKKLETKHEKYVAEKTAEIADLKEQLRDLMFFLEGRQKIEESPLKSELAEGQVIVDNSPKPSGSSSRRKRK